MADDFRPAEEDRIVERPAPPTERYGRRGRRLMTAMVAIAAVLGFGVILVYAYNKGRQDGESSVPPVIQAQEGPTKVRPESPGGMVVPDRDKEIFTRLETEAQPDKVERLLPPPEKPMQRPEAAPESSQMTTVEPAAGAKDEQTTMTTETPTVAAPEPVAPPPSPPAAAPEAPPAPPPAAEKAPAPEPVMSKPEPPKPEPQMAAKSPPPARPDPAGAWKVQLSSLKSDAAARKFWSATQKKHDDLLGPLSLNVQQVTLSGGKGTYYRVQAGPIASKSGADALCAKLKARKQGCLVVRP